MNSGNAMAFLPVSNGLRGNRVSSTRRRLSTGTTAAPSHRLNKQHTTFPRRLRDRQRRPLQSTHRDARYITNVKPVPSRRPAAERHAAGLRRAPALWRASSRLNRSRHGPRVAATNA